MTVTIKPSRPVGSVSAPPSKSMAHRLLLCAGLSSGLSWITGIDPSEDIAATLDCLVTLGAKVDLSGNVAMIVGCDPASAGGVALPCRESGSTLRFFLPLCLLSGRENTLSGSPSLLARPLSVYENLAEERGFLLKKEKNAVRVAGKLTPGEYLIPGNVSSQFISGLLFALPLLPGDSTIRLLPPVESRSYLDLTLSALSAFGVRAEWRDALTLFVPGRQSYSPATVTVEGDWSNAAPFLALGVPVGGLNNDSLQGDRIVAAYLTALEKGPATLDLSDCPDLAPVLLAYAALRHGGRFTGTKRLAIKECDRGEAMKEELAKCGVTVGIGDNEITVGGDAKPPVSDFSGHNDHRIVMATAVLAASLGGRITGAEAVRKSYPGFFTDLMKIQIKVEIKDGMDLKQ